MHSAQHRKVFKAVQKNQGRKNELSLECDKFLDYLSSGLDLSGREQVVIYIEW